MSREDQAIFDCRLLLLIIIIEIDIELKHWIGGDIVAFDIQTERCLDATCEIYCT